MTNCYIAYPVHILNPEPRSIFITYSRILPLKSLNSVFRKTYCGPSCLFYNTPFCLLTYVTFSNRHTVTFLSWSLRHEKKRLDPCEPFSVFTVTPYNIRIKTIQRKKPRICNSVKDQQINNFAKSQFCTIFRCWVICQNVRLKFIELSMETPCWRDTNMAVGNQ